MVPAIRHLPVLIFVAALWSGAAHGFLTRPGDQDRIVLLPGETAPRVWETEDLSAGQSRAGAGIFLESHGGSWRVQWNAVTGTAHHLIGSGLWLTGSPVHDQDEAVAAARDFLLSHADLFGVTSEGMVLRTVTRAAGKWSVIFDQVFAGIPVRGGRAHAVFTEEGRLFAAGSDFHPRLDLPTVPALGAAEAAAVAGSDLGFRDDRDTVEEAVLQVVPIETSGRISYRLAWAVKLRIEDPVGLWETLVDASTGGILRLENLIRFFDVQGNVDADVYDPHYCGLTTESREMHNHHVSFLDLGPVTTDENGDFTVTGAMDTVFWNAMIQGTWADVRNWLGDDAAASGSVVEGESLQVRWSDANSRPDERTCYYHVNRVHEYIRGVDPGPVLDDLDYQMTVKVGRTDHFCPGNAWYDYAGINFCEPGEDGGSWYANTGEMSDVIYHEFGHGVTHRIYNSQTNPPGDLHEGNADIIANLLTGESIIALGIYLDSCTVGFRNSENTLLYPDDWTGANHHSGQIIAGVVWDAWQEMKVTLGDSAAFDQIGHVWHHGRALILPESQPDQVISLLIADDDDGNLTNGTPHYAEICAGAANHGFDCAALIGTTPEISVAPSLYDITVSAGAAATSELVVENVGIADLDWSLVGMQPVYTKSSAAVTERGTGTRRAPAAAGDRTREFLRSLSDAGKRATLTFSDDMESGQGGWTTVLLDRTSDDLWHLVTTDFNSPSHAWWCGSDSSGTYATGNHVSTALVTPEIDLTGALAPVILEFYEIYVTEPAWDFCDVDVSTDDGDSWIELRSTSGSSGGWNLASIDLSPYAGSMVHIRFHFDSSDELYNDYAGWWVDDVAVTTRGVSWLAFDPAAGSLPAGGIDTVEVTFDATALAAGDYDANIRVASNDMSDPELYIPVVLHVEGGADPDSSILSVNDDLMLAPDGNGDSVMTIVVTVRNEQNNPVAGIPAGDIAVLAEGVSSLGRGFHFCAGDGETAVFYSTAPTDGSGETTILVREAGGCGVVTLSATVSGIDLTAGAVANVRSPDINGDGVVNYFDTFLYIPMLNAATGWCGNLNGSGDGVVNFFDTAKYLPSLANGVHCP